MTLFVSFFCALLLALVLTPAVRDIALRAGWVDAPDHSRKLHPGPVPRVGGVAILLACAAAQLLASESRGLAPLAAPVLLIFAAGLWDDRFGLRPGHKLAVQTAAAMLAWWAGVRIHHLGTYAIDPLWGVPITVLWLVGCSNALNMVDGVDGVAGGIALFASLTTLGAALLQGHYELAAATAPLAGALCGFLRFNFNPASIFLGDCGSLSLGFLLGGYGIIWSHKADTVFGMTAPVLALSMPLIDTAVTVARRLITGRALFEGDRRHIHHRLLDRGLAPREVALVIYGVCAFGAVSSMLLSVAGGHYGALVLLVFCAATCVGIQRLDYTEFRPDSLARVVRSWAGRKSPARSA